MSLITFTGLPWVSAHELRGRIEESERTDRPRPESAKVARRRVWLLPGRGEAGSQAPEILAVGKGGTSHFRHDCARHRAGSPNTPGEVGVKAVLEGPVERSNSSKRGSSPRAWVLLSRRTTGTSAVTALLGKDRAAKGLRSSTGKKTKQAWGHPKAAYSEPVMVTGRDDTLPRRLASGPSDLRRLAPDQPALATL